MKKLAIILVLCLLASCAFAENIDLSKMTFAELQELQQRVNAEIASRPEWKEVEVPAGLWRVGEDIPAGKYSIARVSDNTSGCVSVWGYAKGDYNTGGGYIYGQVLKDATPVVGRVDLKDGNLVELDIPVVFSPVKGLGF